VPCTVADPLRLLFEDLDEEVADDAALALRVRHAGERRDEAPRGIHRHQADAEDFAEQGLDLAALVAAQQAVVDEDAGELIADGAVDERGRHRGVDAAGQTADRPPAGDALGDARHLLLDEGLHRPGAVAAADAVDEVGEHRRAALGVHDLRVELHAPDRLVAVAYGGEG
jgi:hypothetical protein